MNSLDIAEHLKKAREIAGLSPSEVSLQSGIAKKRLGRIEKGNIDVTLSEFLTLCEVIKVAPTSLLSKASKIIRPKVTKQSIEEFLSIRETAELLNMSETTLGTLYLNDEIPHSKIKNNKFLFRWTEIDKWLDMQFNERLSGKERRSAIRGTRCGIEPLLSEREVKDIFRGSVPTRGDESRFVPVYYIRSRKRYRLTDILAYLESSRIDPYDVPRFSLGWKTEVFNRQPSMEELDAKQLEKRFSKSNGNELVPGYEWASINFSSSSLDEIERRLTDFQDSLENKWQMIDTNIRWSGKSFSVSVKYMCIPPAWAGHKVRRVNKRADFQNQLRIRVNEYIAKNVPNERLIEIRYFTDSFCFRPWVRHCATIIFYEADNVGSPEPRAILNPKAKKEYEKLQEEATIRISKRLWQAIEDLKNGNLEPRKFTYLLRQEGVFDRMDRANLLVYKRRDEVLDVKKSSDWSEYANLSFRHYHYQQSGDFARIVKLSAEENRALEEQQKNIKEEQRMRMQEIAYNQILQRKAAIERCESNYQARLEAFHNEGKASVIRENLDEEDWQRLIWIQKYWDQVFIENGRRRRQPCSYSEQEEYEIPILNDQKIADAWKTSRYEVGRVFARLISAGAIFNNVYSGICMINPFLESHLKEATGEDAPPRSWKTKTKEMRFDTLLRPNVEILVELMKKYSNSTIGKIFGVSDVAVKKWMKNFGIERHRRIINAALTQEEISAVRKSIEDRLTGDGKPLIS